MTLFLFALILILLALPIWPYSKRWGYRPAAGIAILALAWLIFFLKTVSSFEIEHDDEETSIKIERKTSDK